MPTIRTSLHLFFIGSKLTMGMAPQQTFERRHPKMQESSWTKRSVRQIVDRAFVVALIFWPSLVKKDLDRQFEVKVLSIKRSIPALSLSHQCDQIGRFIGLWATFQSLWKEFAQISYILSKFCKDVKILNFSSEIIFGQFYRHLATFYWSHCLLLPIGGCCQSKALC